MISGTIFRLTLRQMTGVRRLLIIAGLAALPIVLGIWLRAIGAGDDATSLVEFLIAGAIMPLVSLIVAAPVFADEVDDRTLANLILTPINRWQIALPKVAAAMLVAGAPLVVGAFVTAMVVYWDDGDRVVTAFGVALGMLIGTICYSSFFAFAGTVTTRAVVLGLVYILAWESTLANVAPGLKYLSLSKMSIAIIRWLDTADNVISTEAASVPELGYALIVTAVVTIGSVLLIIWRLRRMDVQ